MTHSRTRDTRAIAFEIVASMSNQRALACGSDAAECFCFISAGHDFILPPPWIDLLGLPVDDQRLGSCRASGYNFAFPLSESWGMFAGRRAAVPPIGAALEGKL
jgi:hypothetical protein